MNVWEDTRVVEAVQQTGRKKVVMAALWTEVCRAIAALSAFDDGYEVYFVSDASAEVTKETHEMPISAYPGRRLARQLAATTWQCEPAGPDCEPRINTVAPVQIMWLGRARINDRGPGGALYCDRTLNECERQRQCGSSSRCSGFWDACAPCGIAAVSIGPMVSLDARMRRKPACSMNLQDYTGSWPYLVIQGAEATSSRASRGWHTRKSLVIDGATSNLRMLVACNTSMRPDMVASGVLQSICLLKRSFG